MNSQAQMQRPFSGDEIQLMLDNLDTYTPEQQEEINNLLNEYQHTSEIEAAYNDLIAFCQYMMPEYRVGKHHRILAGLLMEIAEEPKRREDGTIIPNEKDRVCVNIPPRHGKSLLVSTYFPAWYLGRHPNKKVMMVSHTTDLAVDFGRKVRNLIATDRYKEIFPNVSLSHDSKSAGRWNTNQDGEYYACGVGSALAGRGADLLLIDDPHSEQDVLAGNFEVFERAYKWYTFGARTRLMPGGRVAIIQTRWHMDDLTGRVIRNMIKDPLADQFHVVEFPAILEFENKETLEITEKPLWPEFFDLDALKRTKASMPAYQWNAQFQQQPTAEEAAIVKREWWRVWRDERPPACEYTIMTLDAAAEAHNRADFTAITTWGVFFNEEEDMHNIILLEAYKDRIEFPELKQLAGEKYEEWEPDAFIVEKKSSGTPLYQEMRRAGVFVQEYTPTRGTTNNPNTKTARLNSVADMVKEGLCWVPEHNWAQDLVEEVAGFPYMQHDDQVDCMIMALMRFRQGGFIHLPTDLREEQGVWRRKKGGYY
jgi:predicted phage terminase large subunit-like protein